MLSYRHAFHAGNHADILKHTTLLMILESLRNKEKPFTAIDSHAGAGIYHLDDERALTTGESQSGILTLQTQSKDEMPYALTQYLSIVKKYTDENKYPGSPEIIRSMLREDDKEILMELHNTEIEILKANISDRRVSIYHENCFTSLKAHTPPLIKRGFLLMDPSYEVDSDYTNAASAICECHKKWNVGILALWYPLLKHRKVDLEIMLDSINECAFRTNSSVYNTQLLVDSEEKETGLYGSGMIVVNPCWHLDEQINSIVEYLQSTMFSKTH